MAEPADAQVAVDSENALAQVAREALVALLGDLGSAMDFGAGLHEAKTRRAGDKALTEREVGLLDAAVTLIRASSVLT